MYKLVTVKDTVRIPPNLFSESLEDSVIESLKTEYEGKLDKELGVMITVLNPREVGEGRIIHGDGASYHEAIFDILAFKPEMNEIVKASVSDITEFGAFLRFGPIDGLVHVSQITDDFMSFNEKTGDLAGKDSNKCLKKEDVVSAKIIAVSMKNTVSESKINLTMRQPGLGKEKWIKESTKNKKTKGKKKGKK